MISDYGENPGEGIVQNFVGTVIPVRTVSMVGVKIYQVPGTG